MNIKTIKSKNSENFDKEVNTFGESHKVKFTQTHAQVIQGNPASIIYVAVLFYEE